MVEKRQVSNRVSSRVSRPWNLKEMQTYNDEKTAIIKVENTKSLKNPTPQMTNVLKRIELRKKGLLQSLFPRRKAGYGNYFKLRKYFKLRNYFKLRDYSK